MIYSNSNCISLETKNCFVLTSLVLFLAVKHTLLDTRFPKIPSNASCAAYI